MCYYLSLIWFQNWKIIIAVLFNLYLNWIWTNVSKLCSKAAIIHNIRLTIPYDHSLSSSCPWLVLSSSSPKHGPWFTSWLSSTHATVSSWVSHCLLSGQLTLGATIKIATDMFGVAIQHSNQSHNTIHSIH